MRLFWTFFWTFLLVQMATYVMGSMQGIGYNFTTGSLLGVIVTVLVLVVAALIPDEPAGDHRH
ncbi:YjzD family protein [Geobacillus stearothermophilus]|uniref:YjzD family protein n=1 Tax=Geobacillus stearothermophilus TaxID=1422 RepID=UPI001F419119|nr:YjzD family protein [Geobacillus stearothermophilus]MCK7605585.1 YjzD family protein [Geobacillus stearothermophilus]